jgi:hypothetical protein
MREVTWQHEGFRLGLLRAAAGKLVPLGEKGEKGEGAMAAASPNPGMPTTRSILHRAAYLPLVMFGNYFQL